MIEEPLADDFIHLAAVLLNRRNRLCVSVILLGKVVDQRLQLARSVEIDIVLEVRDDDAGAGATRQRIEQPFERSDREVSKGRIADRLALGHLQIARQLVEKNEHRLVAERSNPFIDTGCAGSIAPERRHHLALAELLADKPPQEVLRILVAVEYDNFRDAEFGSGPYSRDHLAAQLRIRREQSERDEAMGLTSAHRLGEIEGSVVAPSCEPFEAPLD